MPPLNSHDRARYRVGRWLGAGAIVLGLASAVGSLVDGVPQRALLPLVTVGFVLWWLRQLPRGDAS